MPDVERYINTVVNKSTGRTPFEALHGYLPDFSDDLLPTLVDETQHEVWSPAENVQQEVQQMIKVSRQNCAKYYDMKRVPAIKYAVGDVVVVRRLPIHTEENRRSFNRNFEDPT